MSTQFTSKVPIWVRLAVHVPNIKAGLENCWRVYTERTGVPHEINRLSLRGMATDENHVQGCAKDGDANGLTAWIDMYGSILIENGIARMLLADPPSASR